MKEYYVYELKFTNGKIYVGSTGNIRVRLSQHYSGLKTRSHCNKPMQDLYDQGHRFVVSLSRVESKESALTIEQLYITRYQTYGNSLNIGMSSKGGDNLTAHPERVSIIAKITEGVNRRNSSMTTEELRVLHSQPGEKNGMYGKTHTKEARRMMSAASIGHKRNIGRVATDETKRKMSVIASARTGTKNPFYGKHHTDEYKRRASVSRLGQKPTNCNRISVDGVIYISQADAAKALGVCIGTVTHRLKSKNPKYSGYHVIK